MKQQWKSRFAINPGGGFSSRRSLDEWSLPEDAVSWSWKEGEGSTFVRFYERLSNGKDATFCVVEIPHDSAVRPDFARGQYPLMDGFNWCRAIDTWPGSEVVERLERGESPVREVLKLAAVAGVA